MHFSWTAGTYIPKKEVEVVETIRATIIQPNQAIRLRARKETKVRDVYLQQKMFMYENKFLLIQINKTFRVLTFLMRTIRQIFGKREQNVRDSFKWFSLQSLCFLY